jgi:hypothetical protein
MFCWIVTQHVTVRRMSDAILTCDIPVVTGTLWDAPVFAEA